MDIHKKIKTQIEVFYLVDNKLSLKEKLSYGMGSLGASTIYGLMSTYLLLFYTDYFGIAAASVGILFLVARIFDAVTDLIMGIIVDNTNSKWGKFRPFILIAPIFIAITTVLVFIIPDFTYMGKLVWAYSTYILWGLAFTSRDIPFWALSAVITQDTQERNTVVTLSRTIAMVGIISVNVVTLPLVNKFSAISPNLGWPVVAAIYGTLCVVFSALTFFNVKEKVVARKEHKQTIKAVFEQLKVNTPLLTLLGFMLISEIVLTLKNIFPIYYLSYNYNSPGLIPVFMGVYAIMIIVGAGISPFTAKRIGKKKTLKFAIVFSAIMSIGIFITGYKSILILFVFIIPMGIADGVAEVIRNSMLADTVEYGQWKTGLRSEGMIFSTNIFKTKVAAAIGGAFGAFTLSSIGYVPNIVQTAKSLNGIHYAFTIVPGLLVFLSLIPLSKYTLTEEKYNEIVEKIKIREKEEDDSLWQ